ncbi:hypothetical protein [Acidipropionibacterium timonense]|uniref:hypothetical protein n=1 Tax=Acidipropionibacterium timonense TaxID=2161818 RepID=UPI001030D104|nr:hypothetical protein [Acidipropionibacterium timonense]
MADDVGNQLPRFRVAPPYRVSAGADAAKLGAMYGLTPDPWQAAVLDDWLAETRSGKLLSGVCALVVPRQNGKNAVLEIVELFKATVQGRRILHTAHEVKTARKAFARLRSFFENRDRYPDLAMMVKAIRSTNGQEAIILHHPDCRTMASGCGCAGWGSVEFVARSRGSGRGFTADDLVCDEFQELSDEQLEALLPTISAAPSGDPQQLFTGTPPGPLAPGEVAMRIRRQAHATSPKRVAWTEFSIPDDMAPEVAMRQWRKLAQGTNPALGIRLNMQTVSDEHESMSPEGFCRERLGQWDRATLSASAIPVGKWAESAVDDVEPAGPKSFGVAFSRTGASVALAGALKTADAIHVEVIAGQSGDMGHGLGSLADWLAARWQETAQIVMAGASSPTLAAELADRGVPQRMVVVANTGQYVEACAGLLDAVKSGTLTHPAGAGPRDMLEASVASAVQKPRGSGWGWRSSRRDGDEIAIEAASLAVWAARTTRRRPRASRKGKRVSII